MRIFTVILIVFFSQKIQSQEFKTHLNHSLIQTQEYLMIKYQTNQFTTLKPFNTKSKYENYNDTIVSDTKNVKNYLSRKILRENLAELHEKNIKLIINPVFDISLSTEKNFDKKYYQNTRGFELTGQLGKYISFYTALLENQAKYPAYINEYITRQLVVPGQGARKDFETDGHDFSQSMGFVTIKPHETFSIEFGNGKHFVGNGYRSLLLSDNTFSYPYLKLNYENKYFQYTAMFTEFNMFENHYYNYHYKKHGTFTWLSILPTKNTEISIFEGIIWQTTDSASSRNIPVDYYKPIILARLINYSMNDADNFVIGLNVRHNFLKKYQAYGQFVLDDFDKKQINGNNNFNQRYGYQIGAKAFNFINTTTKIQYMLNVEYNQASPYTYAHNDVLQNYSHHNQPLAHPIGGGFREIVAIADMQRERLKLRYIYTNALSSNVNDSVNYGTDIFFSDLINIDTHNKIGQGAKRNTQNHNITISYILNPKARYEFFISFTSRKENIDNETRKTHLATLGLRTNIFNYYFDF